jgi:sporulation protein YlmC with PRC-barrel domain
MIIIAYITFSILLSIVVILYGINTYSSLYQREVYNNRFIVVPTLLDLHQDEEDEDEFSEDIRKLINQDSSQTKVKRVTTQTVIDLEEILIINEWTTSRFEDESITSDCTMITFRSGDRVLVMESLPAIEATLNAYLELKSMKR